MIEPPGSFVFSRMDKCIPTETKAYLQRPTGAHRTAPSLSGSHGRSGRSVGGRGWTRGGKYLWPKDQPANTGTSQPNPFENRIFFTTNKKWRPRLQVYKLPFHSTLCSNISLKALYLHSAKKSPIPIPSMCVYERYSQSV